MILNCPNIGIVFTHGVQLHGQVIGRVGINILPRLYLQKNLSKV